MKRFSLLAAAVAASCLPLAAQASPLVVKTTNEELAYSMLDRFGEGGDLPELGEGQVWKIALDDGGAALAAAVPGSVGLVHVEMQPAALMKMFSAQVGRAQGMVRGMASMGLGQAGIKTKDASEIVARVFDLPKQIAMLTVDVDGDPDRPEQGFDVRVDLAPKADTWLARVVGATRATGKGAPKLDNPGAAMQMVFDCDMQALAEPLSGFTQFIVKFGTDADTDTGPRMAAMDSYWKAIGHGFAMNWDLAGSGMAMAIALQDADGMRSVLDSEAYAEWTEAMAAMAPGSEAEVTRKAWAHRGVDVLRSVVDMRDAPGPPNPMFRDGMMESHAGVAGDYLVGVSASTEADMKSLIDRALDQDIETVKLPEHVVGKVRILFAEMMAQMTQGMVPTDEMPAQVDITLTNPGSRLQLHMVMR